MSTDNYGPVPPDGSFPAAPPPGGYPPVPGDAAQPYGTMPPTSPVPGYGQSGPAPMPTPGYGQAPGDYPPAASYPPVPVTPDPYTQYNSGPMGAPVLADFGIRVKGAVIDWLPILILNIISGAVQSSVLTSIISLATLAWVLYNNCYLAGSTGQSFGKKWAGTRLLREDNMQPLGFGMALLRHICHIIDSLICCIGYLFPLFTPKKQTIADMVVKSLVVVDPH